MRATLIDLQLAVKSVLRQWRRSAFALAAVSCGVASLLLASGFIEWNFHFYREAMIGGQLGHIQVHRAGYAEQGQADPFDYLIDARSPEYAALAGLPHVTAVAPRIAINGLLSHDDATLPFIAEGVDPALEAGIEQAVTLAAGEHLAAADRSGILLGKGLAENLGVDVGDRVVLLANTGDGAINGTEKVVRGLFTTVSKAYDDAALRMDLESAQELVRVHGAHAWLMFLDDTRHTRAVLAQARNIVAGSGYELAPWWTLSDFYNKSAALFAKQIGFMKAIIGLLIALLISNTLTMGVMARTGEIGTSMALGATRTRILRRFFAEGLVLALAGALLGCLLGLGIAAVVSAIGIPVPPPPGMGQALIGEILITPRMVTDATLLAILATTLASVHPAWKASRMIIVDALRYNRA